MISDGMSANRNGAALEKFTEGLLLNSGYVECENRKWLFDHQAAVHDRVYAKQVVIGEDTIGGKRRVDFFVVNRNNPAFLNGVLVIEDKWQQSGGSTDKKLLALPDDIDYGQYLTLVILAGRGCNPKIEERLKDRAKTDPFFFAVWGQEEAQIQANGGFFGTGIIRKVQPLKPAKKIIQLSGLWTDLQAGLS